MIKAPYDERNQADYLALTNCIEGALDLISSDSTIPATEVSLAELAGCSRGTLRNRAYPLERLRAIKKLRAALQIKSRNSSKDTAADGLNINPDIDEKFSLQLKLDRSRSEIAIWVAKYSDLERDFKRIVRLKEILLQSKEMLERQVCELKVLLQERDLTHSSEGKIFLVKK